LLATLIHWFPERKFNSCGGWRLCQPRIGAVLSFGIAGHVTLVSRFHPQANLYKRLPTVARKRVTARTKGSRLPKPAEAVKRSKAKRFT